MNTRYAPGAPILAALALIACAAAPPPTDYLQGPEEALAAAVAAGAEEHAPVDLRFAREKLESARSAAAEGDYDEAVLLARQAEIDGEVAAVRAEVAKARRANLRLERRNDTLQGELESDR